MEWLKINFDGCKMWEWSGDEQRWGKDIESLISVLKRLWDHKTARMIQRKWKEEVGRRKNHLEDSQSSLEINLKRESIKKMSFLMLCWN